MLELIFPLLLLTNAVDAVDLVGQKAKNMRVIPAWELTTCDGKHGEVRAAYTFEEANQLKQVDENCAHCFVMTAMMQEQIKDYKKVSEKMADLMKLTKDIQKQDKENIDNLVKQLKVEIAAKNQYKYQSSYSWSGWVIGGALSAVALGVILGVATN